MKSDTSPQRWIDGQAEISLRGRENVLQLDIAISAAVAIDNNVIDLVGNDGGCQLTEIALRKSVVVARHPGQIRQVVAGVNRQQRVEIRICRGEEKRAVRRGAESVPDRMAAFVARVKRLARLVVPMTAIGGSVLTCRKTWLIPVSSSRGSLAVPANATALVVKSDSLAGLMMVVTGPLVSGNLPGATRRRMSPTPFVSIPAI